MTVPRSPTPVGGAPGAPGPEAPKTPNRHAVTPRPEWVSLPERVYAVAHKHGLRTADVLRALQQLGYWVRSAAARIPPGLDVARLVETVASLPPSTPGGTLPPWTPPPPEPVTAREAAQRAGVAPATVRQWVARGYLVPVGKRGSAHLFDPVDVRRVQRETAARRPRTTGDALGTVRYSEPRQLRRQDLDALVTGPRAAELVGVAPSTVRMWVARGHLVPRTPGPRPLFRLRDVLAVRRRKHPRPTRLLVRLDPE